MDKLAVILPSRGLMFSETFEELLRELEDFNYEIYWSHEKSLPNCFNDPTKKILKDKDVFAVLICEDDMIIPKGILKQMFLKNYPVVALDYPFKENGDATTLHDPNGFAYWTGTGFLLVAKQILVNMKKPIWKTKTSWDTMVKGDLLALWPVKLKKIVYGLHDVNFGLTLYSQELPILPMKITAGQRKLISLGTPMNNNGAHDIKLLTRVGKDMVVKTINKETTHIFQDALKRVNKVQIYNDTPPFIKYINNKAVYIGEGPTIYV